MVMQNPEMDPQDQRKTSSMEDSAAVTIEYLRARLLSERSVSRSARQRVDELAKRVMELEEQLNVVTLQRKMAENATIDVLAILESQGISDDLEDFDLGSEPEMPYESGVGNDSVKEDLKLMSSRERRHRSDELSGSDLDSSLVSGGSLSWKGRVDSPRSLEKYKTSNARRRSSFSSVSSSPKHRLGRSCRQIRRREARLVVEESRDKSPMIDSKENEVVCSSEGFPNYLDSESNILRVESKIQDEDKSKVKLANNNCDNGYEREKNMEKALEHQAQLIGQFEAMEKAQREWEEKFRENNNSTPESCDPGNHSDITEEREDSKTQTPRSARLVTSNSQEAKTKAGDTLLPEEMSKNEPIDNIHDSHDGTRDFHNQKSTTLTTSGLLSQKNSHYLLKGKQNYVSSENDNSQPSDRLHQGSHTHGSPQNKPTSSLQNDVYDGLPQRDASKSKNDQYALVLHGQPEFSGVLESLKQARMSLQQEISRLPLVEGGYSGKAIKPSGSLSKSDDRYEIPIGSSGLFRLPTDFSDDLTARSNFIGPASGFSSNFHLHKGISRTSGYQFGSSPYPGTRPRFSQEVQSLAGQYMESGSRFDTSEPPFDSLLDGDLPSSGKYMYPRFPIHPSYHTRPQMPFSDGFSRPYPNPTGGVGVPPSDNFSFYDDHARPNVHR